MDVNNLKLPNERIYTVFEPMFSIITPYYNGGDQIFQTAASIFSQTLCAFEWIIVDDGSTETVSIAALSALEKLDNRIKIHRLGRNLGPSAARNKAYSLATTNFVLQIDADDLLEPTTAEKWLCFLKMRPNVPWVGSYHIAFGATNYFWPHSFNERHRILTFNMIQPTCMMRRDIFFDIGGYDESIRFGLEDWEFWLRAANNGIWGAEIPEFLYWYRRRDDHSLQWKNWSNDGTSAFLNNQKHEKKDLFSGEFPKCNISTTGGSYPILSLQLQRKIVFFDDKDLAVNLTKLSKNFENHKDITVVVEKLDAVMVSNLSQIFREVFVLEHMNQGGGNFMDYLSVSRNFSKTPPTVG